MKRHEMPTTTQLQAVYLRSNLAVTITDPNGRITWCNAAFCTMLGTSDSALIGQPLTTLDTSNAPGDDAEVASSGLEAGTDPGVAHRRLVHASGHTVQTCSTTTRACAEDGSTCWITQWFDLTTHHIEREQQETAQRMQALSDFTLQIIPPPNPVKFTRTRA